jgi:hypothetical protein
MKEKLLVIQYSYFFKKYHTYLFLKMGLVQASYKLAVHSEEIMNDDFDSAQSDSECDLTFFV